MRQIKHFVNISNHVRLMKEQTINHVQYRHIRCQPNVIRLLTIPVMKWYSTEKWKQKLWKKPIDESRLLCHNFHTHLPLHCELRPNEMTETQYEALADDTLDSLSEFFDELPEIASCADEYDSEFGSGVLTLHFNKTVGTYVINKQTPNKQIWLSSPQTGPKRYDFCGDKWIYRHDGRGLHQLLEEEVSSIVGSKISLKNCKYYS